MFHSECLCGLVIYPGWGSNTRSFSFLLICLHLTQYLNLGINMRVFWQWATTDGRRHYFITSQNYRSKMFYSECLCGLVIYLGWGSNTGSFSFLFIFLHLAWSLNLGINMWVFYWWATTAGHRHYFFTLQNYRSKMFHSECLCGLVIYPGWGSNARSFRFLFIFYTWLDPWTSG
jgi:hypothetical protein